MTVSWPAVTYEQVAWESSDESWIPRVQRLKHSGPYEAAVPPKIAGLFPSDIPGELQALSDEASAEVARFDAELGSEIAPFAPLLLRSESAASSKIENLTASAKSIALAEIGDPSKHNAAIVVANTRAMEAAIELANRLDEQAILSMHQALLGSSQPQWAGKWRTQQVWIGGSNYGPHDALFVPPQASRVHELVNDLVQFMERHDLPALIQVAIAHAQFETIHPFPDGNGRVGRALVHAMLRAKQLTRNVTVPVSAGLLTNTQTYFDALTAYRVGNVVPIIQSIAHASFAAIHNGRRLVADLHSVRGSWNELITARRNATAWKLADLLIRQPVIDSPIVQAQLKVAATNANTAIEHLENVGIIHKVSGNYRNRKWAALEVLDVLDAFADRATRR